MRRPTPLRDRAPTGLRAVVVGGGLAGLSAATVLAERGVAVTVLEREPYLGGRLGAWQTHLRTGEPHRMERGFHAFFRQYYNLRALMRRVDPTLSRLSALDDYPIVHPDGAVEGFDGLPTRPPLNVAALVARTEHLGWRDLLRVHIPHAMEMIAFDMEATYRRFDHISAEAYLDALNFPAQGRRMLFDVFAHSFFNPEATMSAAELLMMFHFYFTGNPEGLVFDVLTSPFDEALITPLATWLEDRGVALQTGTTVRRVDRRGAGFIVRDGTHAWDADAVVLALNVPGLKGLVEASGDLDDTSLRTGVESLDVTSPFAVWRRWLDRPTQADRSPFIGTVAMGRLDNISLYHTFEGESRRWARARGGSIVELHAYGLAEPFDEDELRDELWSWTERVYPELRDARVLDERWLLRRDCPAFEVGGHALRPGVDTAIPGLCLAGDFVKLPIPSALMERAATSGMMAANAILARHDVRGAPVLNVPTRGVVARPWQAIRGALARLPKRRPNA